MFVLVLYAMGAVKYKPNKAGANGAHMRKEENDHKIAAK